MVKPKKTKTSIHTTQSHWTTEQCEALDYALKSGATLCYYVSDQWGRPSNGGVQDVTCSPMAVHKTKTALICQHGLHATIGEPQKYKGCRVWICAMRGISGSEEDKICGTERLVIGEVLPEECIDARVAVRLGADLSRANLSRADLSRADLSRANLSGADLSWAHLSRADLYGANLYGANLYGADLSWAHLSRANLSGADLSRADLYGANLYGANLYGANLYGKPFTLEDAVRMGALNADKARWQ